MYVQQSFIKAASPSFFNLVKIVTQKMSTIGWRCYTNKDLLVKNCFTSVQCNRSIQAPRVIQNKNQLASTSMWKVCEVDHERHCKSSSKLFGVLSPVPFKIVDVMCTSYSYAFLTNIFSGKVKATESVCLWESCWGLYVGIQFKTADGDTYAESVRGKVKAIESPGFRL